MIDFFQGELIFLFIISISLHNLRTVSGLFLLNNDDSFNVFGLLKKYFGIRLAIFNEIIKFNSSNNGRNQMSLCYANLHIVISQANKSLKDFFIKLRRVPSTNLYDRQSDRMSTFMQIHNYN